MALKIMGDEIYPAERGAHIKTRCPKGYVTDDMVAQAARQRTLDAGDTIRVQCTGFDREATVLYQRDYLVYSRRPVLNMTENDRGDTKTEAGFVFEVEPLTDWFTTRAGKAEEENAKAAAKKIAESAEKAAAEAKPGKKAA